MTQIASTTPPTANEIHAMAGVLARRYGPRAVEVARNFMLEHEDIGDYARASIWDQVSAHLERPAVPPTLS